MLYLTCVASVYMWARNVHLMYGINYNVNCPAALLTKINLGLMINAGMLLASSRRLIFGGPVIALGLTGKSLSAIK